MDTSLAIPGHQPLHQLRDGHKLKHLDINFDGHKLEHLDIKYRSSSSTSTSTSKSSSSHLDINIEKNLWGIG
jgi:hypothetical protein